ncbi:DUF5696 domain-containing protein [Paenibacillus caui]|uniref:DUF5696 domain-containing protein n=1 Tax=Paenibacillus caui TaxID=2873927 RepID=UPI001CA9DB67|nr:DUF5696 domain-containing protein [Paenibacillus caui]
MKMKRRSFAGTVLAFGLILATGCSAYGSPMGHAASPASSAVRNTAAPAPSAVRSTAAAAVSAQGMERVAASRNLALDFNSQTGEIAVTDLRSGEVWTSNPQDLKEDKIAKGTKKMDLRSQLLLEYVDLQSKPFLLNNYTGSIKNKKFEWSKIDGGIEITFTFPKADMTIPVQYTISDDSFSAKILTDRITQGAKYKLVNISLLPFFGAGNLKDDGYLFVPDGSGALIRFNNNKQINKGYNDRVYGADQALTVTQQTAVKEDIKLPVFGIKKNDHAFLAVIHQGAYQAGITADVSRKNNQYNTVYSYLNGMESESNLILEGTANEKQVVRSSEPLFGTIPYEVKYFFLSGDQASYAGMAVRYREYLTEEQGAGAEALGKQDQIPLLMTFLGGIKKRETLFGIPYSTVKALTSYKDLRKAAGVLKEKGLNNLLIKYEGWQAGGLRGKVTTSVKAESNLGGQKQFRKLANELKDEGVAFYPAVDPVHYYKGGNGFHKFWDVAKGISRGPALQYAFRLSDGTKNPKISPWYLLKPESVARALEKFAGSANRYGLSGVAYQGMGSTMYSDFRKRSLSKNQVGSLWQDGLKKASEGNFSMMFEHAAAYTFPFADRLTDVPLYASDFDVEDETVPFYSIVVSGLIPAFSEPVNLSSDPDHYMLKLIETGTYPSYRFIARDGDVLKGTVLDSLYSGNFDSWLDDVTKQYNTLNDAMREIMGRAIIGHEQLGPGVYRTTFEGGKSAIVNYTDEAVTVGAERVEADSYLVQ